MKDAIKEVYDYEWRLANAEKRLAESGSICNEDKETIRRFVRRLKAQDVSTSRLAKYAYHLKNAIERLGTSARRAKRGDLPAAKSEPEGCRLPSTRVKGGRKGGRIRLF
jgi:hypothetical protein